MCNPTPTPACPVCRKDMEMTSLFIEEDNQGRYVLSGCCSLDGMYVHATRQEAEQSLSRYKGLAVQAGIRKAWERLEERIAADKAWLMEDCDEFLWEEADSVHGGMYYVGKHPYCWECAGKVRGEGEPERAYNITRPIQCRRCLKVGKGW